MKKRVLHLLASNRFSGAENVAASIVEGLKSEYDFLYVSQQGPVVQTLCQRDIPHMLIKTFSRAELNKVVNEFKPDLIHAHDYRASLLAATLLKRMISHLHNNVPWAKRCNLGTLSYLAASVFFKKIIVVSNSVIREQKFKRVLSKKVRLVSNAIDLHTIKTKSEQGIAPASDLTFVGRLTDQKDPLQFIQIVKEVKCALPQVQAVMIGEGDLWDRCQREREQSGLIDNLEMLGFQENPFPQMKASKLCLMPSRWEGFGLVALEALGLGVPVLGSPVGGLEDILRPGNQEMLCNSPERFVSLSLKYLKDEVLRSSLGIRLQGEVSNRFSSGKFLNEIQEVYEEALN